MAACRPFWLPENAKVMPIWPRKTEIDPAHGQLAHAALWLNVATGAVLVGVIAILLFAAFGN